MMAISATPLLLCYHVWVNPVTGNVTLHEVFTTFRIAGGMELLKRLMAKFRRNGSDTVEIQRIEFYRYADDPEPREGGIEGVSEPPIVARDQVVQHPRDHEVIDNRVEGVSRVG